MINASDCEHAVKLINRAMDSGARLWKACVERGISKRTFNRWKETNSEFIDKRTICKRPEPANKLTKEEKQEILDVVHSKEYEDLPPSQIVSRLADKWKYIASESTYYRVVRQANELRHRKLSKPPIKRLITTYCATGANQVWMYQEGINGTLHI